MCTFFLALLNMINIGRPFVADINLIGLGVFLQEQFFKVLLIFPIVPLIMLIGKLNRLFVGGITMCQLFIKLEVSGSGLTFLGQRDRTGTQDKN